MPKKHGENPSVEPVLNQKALADLRVALRKSYGDDFDNTFSDEDVGEIGELLLTILAGSLKIKIRNSQS
jgi:hypothetical protein